LYVFFLSIFDTIQSHFSTMKRTCSERWEGNQLSTTSPDWKPFSVSPIANASE